MKILLEVTQESAHRCVRPVVIDRVVKIGVGRSREGTSRIE